uniref:Uncharacterized protein n=1 Tax=Fagus sylvatica TaxID=28930 RepID=A0A2N9FAK2_FAGSY
MPVERKKLMQQVKHNKRTEEHTEELRRAAEGKEIHSVEGQISGAASDTKEARGRADVSNTHAGRVVGSGRGSDRGACSGRGSGRGSRAGLVSERVGSRVGSWADTRWRRRVDLEADLRRKYHRRVAARYRSDGHQILSDGRYGADEETHGGGEMNGASRTRRRRSEPADQPRRSRSVKESRSFQAEAELIEAETEKIVSEEQIEVETKQIKAETEQIGTETEQIKAETEQIGTETEQIKAETEQIGAETEQIKAEF